MPALTVPHRDKEFTCDLQKIIPFLPIVEICHRVLGRGGAERSECPPTPHAPAHPKVPALTMPRARPKRGLGVGSDAAPNAKRYPQKKEKRDPKASLFPIVSPKHMS